MILVSHAGFREINPKINDLAIQYFLLLRTLNPEADIIVSGHGERLSKDATNVVDHIFWSEIFLRSEMGIGHPFTTYKAVKTLGHKYEYIFKTKIFNLPLHQNICNLCEELLLESKKFFIFTQQTSLRNKKLGDLFIFSKVSDFLNVWDPHLWYPTCSGMRSLANIFHSKYLIKDSDSFIDVFRKHCIHINLPLLRIIDCSYLSPIFLQNLISKSSCPVAEIFPDMHNFFWGHAQGYNIFDKDMRMVSNTADLDYIPDTMLSLNLLSRKADQIN